MMKCPDQKSKVFIYGASGHAHFVMNIVSLLKTLDLVGMVDDVSPERVGENFNGVPLLGGREVLPELLTQGVRSCIMGFGNCSARLELGEILKSMGFLLVTAIHPGAYIASSATIGSGVVIGPGAVVDAGSVIGDNCILNNNCCVSHGSRIGTGSHLCPGVTVGGDVIVGASSWIGIGSTVIEKVSIGSGSYIGAGSVVTRSIPDGVLAYGSPARVIRKIKSTF
jgi:UDP-N-acetylbacillosamine N-acetyltransferase